MRPSILLTRSPAQNTAMKRLIEACPALKGQEVVCLPLLDVSARTLDSTARTSILGLDSFDGIIFISKNAVEFGLPELETYWPAWPLALDWYAVGPGTGAQLAKWDIRAEWPSLASSEGLLAECLPPRISANKRYLIVRGKGGRETLKQGLTSAAAAVVYLEVYQRSIIPYDQSESLSIKSTTVSMIYSGEALKHLCFLIGEKRREVSVIVPSQRLEVMATDLGFGKVIRASDQTDKAMLASLMEQA